MIKECKVLKHGKNGIAIVIPKAYKDLLDIEAGNIVDLILDKKQLNKRELLFKVTNKKEKSQE